MPHHNTVFHDILKHVPWGRFDRLVEEHGADFRVRRLTSKSHFVALLYGQLSGASSLRELEAGLSSHGAKLYHVGAEQPRRATLSDASASRPAALFAGLFSAVVAQASAGLRRKTGEAIRLIDSTPLPLNGWHAGWAAFSPGVQGAKAHVVFDPDADAPVYFEVTPANVNDITPAKAMPIDVGATYVFDLGYYDFGWWARLDAQGCRIVTRLKKNTPLAVLERLTVPPDQDNILSDRIGRLPERQCKNRRNPFAKPVREILVRIDGGKVLRVATNDLTSPAAEIADLYKRRWHVELFFRWVKQVLKIKTFLGRSENAVRIQIAVALIAFVLLRIAQSAQNAIASPLAFARLVRANIFHRRPIDSLLGPPPEPSPPKPQLAWDFAKC